MKKPFVVLILVIISVIIPSKIFAQATLEKAVAKPVTPKKNIDVQHVAIDLRFDWKRKRAYGTSSIMLKPLVPLSRVVLDAGMLTINWIKLADSTSLRFNYDGGDGKENLEILLDRVYSAAETIQLNINYHTNYTNEADPNNIWGSTGKGIRFFEPTSTTPIKRKQAWTSGEPESNRYWFPDCGSIEDLRTTEFTATVDQPLIAISNGNLIATKNNPDGSRSFHYQSEVAYPNYLTSFVIGNYVDVKQQYENIGLHSFGYPDEKKAITATVARLPDMVKFFSGITGVKYPYNNYTQAVVQDYPFPGLNGQHAATTISDNMIDDDRTHADYFYLWDGIESQALASQWFGNLISPASWEHIWLNQSFCHYLDGLYTDHKNGHDEFLSYYLLPDMATTLGDWQAGYRHPIVTKQYNDLALFSSDNYSKIRGALLLRMLRNELGEKAWWKAFQYYIRTNANKQVRTEDFVTAVEKTSGRPMQWFFDQWIYQMGHPVFEVSKTYDAVKQQLLLTVKQLQEIDKKDSLPQVSLFRGKIGIAIDGKIHQVELEPKREQTFSFAILQQPKLVQFDVENTWIKEIRFEKSFDEWLYQSQHDKDITGRYTAIDSLVKIAKLESTSPADKDKIITALRSIISGKSYWRLRTYALSQLRAIFPAPYDKATIVMLLKLIKSDKPWVRTSAIFSLGLAKDSTYADLYIEAFRDPSDRVINAAANALGKSKSSKAFDALVKLKDKPSWKSQSLISALNGLKELGDPRGAAIALTALANVQLPRWWLATPMWDYPIAAAETLVALKKADAAFPMILERFKKSMKDNDVNDIFANLLLITTLEDPRGSEAFDALKIRFKDDVNAMAAVTQYETKFRKAIAGK